MIEIKKFTWRLKEKKGKIGPKYFIFKKKNSNPRIFHPRKFVQNLLFPQIRKRVFIFINPPASAFAPKKQFKPIDLFRWADFWQMEG